MSSLRLFMAAVSTVFLFTGACPQFALAAEMPAPTSPPVSRPSTQPAATRPTAGDIKEFVADPMADEQRAHFKDFKVTRQDLEVILKGWVQVTGEEWEHCYSHIAFNDRTGHVVLKDGRQIKWMVKPGGLAWIQFPDGQVIYLAASPPVKHR